jgi:hypothetical protein
MHYDNLQNCIETKKSVPTLLFSIVLMRWHSIFLKCNLVLFVLQSKILKEFGILSIQIHVHVLK